MPYYSDNLYSADDSDDDAQRYYHGGVEEEDDDAAAEAAAGHVSDGFFHASDPQYDTGSSSPLWAGVQSSPPASGGPAPDSSSSSGHNDNEQPWSTTSDHNGQRQWTAPMSAQVPFVPNILIPDPSLEQREQLSRAESKAAEARLESQGLYNRPQAPHAEPPAAPTTPRRTPYSPPSHPPTGAGSNGQPGPSSYLSDNHTYAATQQGYRGYQSHHQPTSGHYRQVSASSSGTLARDLYYGHGRQPSAAGAGVVDIPEIQAGEAPPAYTPSPTTTAGSTAAATLSPQSTGPSAARPPGVAIGYNTFTPVTTTSSGSSGAGNENGADLEAHAYRNGSSAMGQIDEEWRALLGGGHEPQSLSRPSQDGLGRNSDEYEQAPLLWRRKVAGSRARRFCRGCCKALLVFVLVTMVLGSIVSLLQELGDDLPSHGGDDPVAKDPTDPGFLFPDDPDRGDGDLPPGYVPPGDKDAESDGGDSGDGPFPPNDNFCRPHAGHVSRLSYQLQFAANRNVTFGQSVYALHDDDGDSAPWSDLRVGGVVLVKRVSGKDARKPTITLDLATNSPELEDLIRIEWKEDCQTLAVRVPNRIHWASASLAAVTGKKQAHGESTEPARPCVEMRVTINVPKGAELEALWLATVHLGVRLFEDVDLTVHSGTVISTIVGSIAGAYVPNPAAGPRAISAEDPELSSVTASDSRLISANRATLGLQLAGTTSSLVSRDISVSSIAGRIWGTWPLYDSLRIASKSGSVHIDVLPQMVNPDNVKPAYLWVQSYSGDVVIKEPGVGAEDGDSDTVGRFLEASSKLPARDYIVDVSSISGSIKLHVAASSAATITSSAGAVTAVLLPVLDEALGWDGNEKTAPWLSPSTAAAGAGGVGPGRPLIETSTHAGSMELEILEPRWVSADELKGESVPPPAHDSPPASLPDNSVPFLPIGDDDPYSWLPGVADRSVHATHGTTADTESHARTASDAPVSPDGPAARLVPPSPAPEPNDPVGRRSALLLACLTTRHEAAAGNIQLRYPNAWRGDLGASTSVGSLKVRGKGVQVVRRGGGIGKLWLVARKGSEEDFGDGRGSVADVRLFSGNMEVLIGKEE